MRLDLLLVFLLPIIFPIVSGVLVFKGLEKSNLTIQWSKVSIGLTLLIPMIIFEYVMGTLGYLGIVGFIFGIYSAVSSIVTGVILIFVLPKWRKIIGSVFCVIYPLGMWFSLLAGNAQSPPSPENITQENGNLIIQALEEHYSNEGYYPIELKSLVPEYLDPLPEALTTQKTGWLYESTGSEFALGYWYWPEKYGSWVCLYGSKMPEWECDFNNWGDFEAVMTPMPPGYELSPPLPTDD